MPDEKIPASQNKTGATAKSGQDAIEDQAKRSDVVGATNAGLGDEGRGSKPSGATPTESNATTDRQQQRQAHTPIGKPEGGARGDAHPDDRSGVHAQPREEAKTAGITGTGVGDTGALRADSTREEVELGVDQQELVLPLVVDVANTEHTFEVVVRANKDAERLLADVRATAALQGSNSRTVQVTVSVPDIEKWHATLRHGSSSEGNLRDVHEGPAVLRYSVEV
jgi:hypothetical protein